MDEVKRYRQIDWEKVDLSNKENYDNPPEIVLTENEILEKYWTYWVGQMEKKYGKGHELITRENCLEDYVVGHFATEVKDG